MTTESTRVVDYGPLTMPVASGDVANFKAQARASGQPWAIRRFTGSTAVTIVVLVFVAIFFGFVGLSILLSLIAGVASGSLSATALIVPLAFALLLVGGVSWAVRSAYRAIVPGNDTWTRWFRLTEFAEHNGMFFSPSEPGPSYPGAIFGIGDTRLVYDHLYRNEGRFLDIGDYSYMTGSGKSRETHKWGFMALRLDRTLPNMVLDAKSNNKLFGSTNLPFSFSKDQVLPLEGDFDQHFTLYCPKEYETDALYVFTPDLMALLIDQTAQFDVEIVDDWMFAYSSAPLNMSDVATLNHLFKIVDTVGAKTVTQTERYADDRVGNPGADMVAPEGRRLKRRWPVIATVVGVLVFAYWLGSLIFGLTR